MFVQPKRKKGGGRKGQQQRMPECTYGAACRRKGCVYRHPKKGTQLPSTAGVCVPVGSAGGAGAGGVLGAATLAAEAEDWRPVCVHFIGGLCTFGNACRNRHPGEEEAALARARLAQTPCRFGLACRTAGCIYLHPVPEPEPQVDFSAAPAMAMPAVQAVSWPRRQASQPQNAGGSAAGGFAAADGAASKSVRERETVPTELWVPQYLRNPAIFQEQDPMLRYAMVMESHGGRKHVIDLHYQSTRTAPTVLDSVLAEHLANISAEQGLWIITGTGHHVAEGHQKGGGVLYEAVDRYLTERGIAHVPGKDATGRLAGAFFLKRA